MKDHWKRGIFKIIFISILPGIHRSAKKNRLLSLSLTHSLTPRLYSKPQTRFLEKRSTQFPRKNIGRTPIHNPCSTLSAIHFSPFPEYEFC